jgi:hypothetical protein
LAAWLGQARASVASLGALVLNTLSYELQRDWFNPSPQAPPEILSMGAVLVAAYALPRRTLVPTTAVAAVLLIAPFLPLLVTLPPAPGCSFERHASPERMTSPRAALWPADRRAWPGARTAVLRGNRFAGPGAQPGRATKRHFWRSSWGCLPWPASGFGQVRRWCVPILAVLASLNRETGVFLPLALLLASIDARDWWHLDAIRRAAAQRETRYWLCSCSWAWTGSLRILTTLYPILIVLVLAYCYLPRSANSST